MDYFDLGHDQVPVELLEEASFCSRHTGATLRTLKIRVVAKDQSVHEELQALTREPHVSLTNGRSSAVSNWKVKNKSYSYTDGPDCKYFHSLDLEEVEDLKLDYLALGTLNLKPYVYEERFDGEALIIDAKCLLSVDEYSTLKGLFKGEQYFPVIRFGISDEPREMRFGVMRWSTREEGVKHELCLVEKCYDDLNADRGGLFWPEMPLMRDMIAEYAETLDGLINTLVVKELLQVEEVECVFRRN